MALCVKPWALRIAYNSSLVIAPIPLQKGYNIDSIHFGVLSCKEDSMGKSSGTLYAIAALAAVLGVSTDSLLAMDAREAEEDAA